MPRFQVGDKIGGQYEVLSLLGTGGMSDVYRCDDLVLKRKVAVKVLHINPEEAPQALMRLQQEGQAIARFEHKNIIKPHGAAVTLDGVPYLVMEIVTGQSLSTLLKGGSLTWPRTLRIICQICDALAHAHERGVVHRDLKPSNIMLENVGRADEQVKLLDFGIAKVTADATIKATKAGEVFGTPAYMSPEQAEGKTVDARADQYAVGCLLYEMLTGNPPFTGDNALSLLMQHVQNKPPSLEDMSSDKLPTHVEAVYQRMMEKRPEKRFATIKDAQDALTAANSYVLRQHLRDWLFNRWAVLILVICSAGSIATFAVLRQPPAPDKDSGKVLKSQEQGVQQIQALGGEAELCSGDAKVGIQYHIDKLVTKMDLSGELTFSSNGTKMLSQFRNLKDLNLHKTFGIDDETFQDLKNLPLEKLDLAKTAITDKSMPAIGQMRNLVSLSIGNTGVTDAGCRYLEKLTKLKWLSLKDLKGVTSKTLSVVGRLNVTGLELEGIPAINDSLALLKPLHLTTLSLHSDDVHDQQLQELSGQSQMRVLNLDDNELLTDDGILRTITKMPALTYLNLNRTGVTPNTVALLRKRLPSCRIEYKGTSKHRGGFHDKPLTKADQELFNKF